jgi:hypothetical protein
MQRTFHLLLLLHVFWLLCFDWLCGLTWLTAAVEILRQHAELVLLVGGQAGDVVEGKPSNKT